jgi:hypothetical protein
MTFQMVFENSSRNYSITGNLLGISISEESKHANDSDNVGFFWPEKFRLVGIRCSLSR